MTLKISKTWAPSLEEWEQAWMGCPYSTFFHGPAWAEIWSKYSSGKIKPAPIAMAFSDGTRVLLPFSMEDIYRGAAKLCLSSPAGTFGGWLAPEALNNARQDLIMEFIDNHFGDFLWRTNPYESLTSEIKIGRTTPDETQVLDLTVGFDAIFRGWTKGHASAVRQAQKAGVEICLAQNLSDWKAYFSVYESSLDRWGDQTTQAYSWRLFELFSELPPANVNLWLARFEGEAIAGALCLYAPSHVVYWHGAALGSHFHLRPVNLMLYEAIRHATEHGYHWFDFNPSGGLEGVKAFKRSFGTLTLPSDMMRKTSGKVRLLSVLSNLVRGTKRSS